MIPPNILCKRNDCEAEFTMRAMEAVRQTWYAAGERKSEAKEDHWHACKICKRTVGWERLPGGLVKAL